MWLILLIILYLLIGLAMVLWDYRKAIFTKNNPDQSPSSVYLEKPTFLNSLSISSALVFMLLWPVKILRKIF